MSGTLHRLSPSQIKLRKNIWIPFIVATNSPDMPESSVVQHRREHLLKWHGLIEARLHDLLAAGNPNLRVEIVGWWLAYIYCDDVKVGVITT